MQVSTLGPQKGHDYIHRVRTVLNVCLPMEPLHIRRVLNFLPAIPEFRKNVPVLKPDEVLGIKEVLRNPEGRISLRDRAIGVLAFYAGLRSIDIVNLKISSIDWENDRLCFTQQKTQVPVEIPLSAMVFPVFFRLLYSSGMRDREARMLLTGDVDLEHGVIGIHFSKENGQHYVVLHDSMLALMRRYDAAVKTLYPGRKYFFPADSDSHFHKRTVSKYFRRFWDDENSSHAIVYALRHNYAIENINAWTGTGTDFFLSGKHRP